MKAIHFQVFAIFWNPIEKGYSLDYNTLNMMGPSTKFKSPNIKSIYKDNFIQQGKVFEQHYISGKFYIKAWVAKVCQMATLTQKTLKTHISTSNWSAEHSNAGQNIQHILMNLQIPMYEVYQAYLSKSSPSAFAKSAIGL